MLASDQQLCGHNNDNRSQDRGEPRNTADRRDVDQRGDQQKRPVSSVTERFYDPAKLDPVMLTRKLLYAVEHVADAFRIGFGAEARSVMVLLHPVHPLSG